jgi:hypothetical protein
VKEFAVVSFVSRFRQPGISFLVCPLLIHTHWKFEMETEALIMEVSKSGRTVAPEPPLSVTGQRDVLTLIRRDGFVSRSFEDALDSLAYFGGWRKAISTPGLDLWLGFAADLERDDPNSLRRLWHESAGLGLGHVSSASPANNSLIANFATIPCLHDSQSQFFFKISIRRPEQASPVS